MTKLKFNSATAQFEELDLDLLSLVAAGAAPTLTWLPKWQEDVFCLDCLDVTDGDLATVDETVYASDGGVTWNKKYS